MCLFVHMTGTTGQHATERRQKVYARRCAQCRKEVGERDRVAAHVYAWACGWVPLGATLRTTCKRCNHTRNPRRRFWGCKRRLRRLPLTPSSPHESSDSQTRRPAAGPGSYA